MRILFVHQNFPGQFRHLVKRMLKHGHEVHFVCQKGRPTHPGVTKIEYEPHRGATRGLHPYLAQTELGVINGQNVARALFDLREAQYRPDIMIGNPGWGETLYLKDVYPDVPVISYCEFFYKAHGADVGFDPEFPPNRDVELSVRTRTGLQHMALEASDYRYSPTHWQKSQFPCAYRESIEVIHDGIDTQLLRPDENVQIALASGARFTRNDQIVTYVARDLEPYRGFHTFMRAIPRILAQNPAAHIIIVGANGVSYGNAPANGMTWRQNLTSEIGLTSDRVHFLGRVPYPDYVRILQLSAAHVYLTYPFVLSWSMLEAMSVGCPIIASQTPPVSEVITENQNGRLTDFFDPIALAQNVSTVLKDREFAGQMGLIARRTVQDRFELSACLDQQEKLIARAIAGS